MIWLSMEIFGVWGLDPTVPNTGTFVECPAGSVGQVDGRAGRDGDSGCVVLAGYSGKAVALTKAPWVSSTIEAVPW